MLVYVWTAYKIGNIWSMISGTKQNKNKKTKRKIMSPLVGRNKGGQSKFYLLVVYPTDLIHDILRSQAN